MYGSLNNLPERGELYEPKYHNSESTSNVNVEWEEKHVEVQKKTPVKKNEFQSDLEYAQDPTKLLSKPYNFEHDVNVWSDFLYARFHPRSVNVVREYQHCNDHTPFDAFPLGVDLWKSEKFEEDFGDKIRNYVEECDHFQVNLTIYFFVPIIGFSKCK